MSTSSDNRTIEDILLKPDAIPAMPPKTMVKEALEMMTAGRLGLACIVDRRGCLVGLFTDGDLRRLLLRSQSPCPLCSPTISSIMRVQNLCPLTGTPAFRRHFLYSSSGKYSIFRCLPQMENWRVSFIFIPRSERCLKAMAQTVLAVIPARWQSTRFPGKPLLLRLQDGR